MIGFWDSYIVGMGFTLGVAAASLLSVVVSGIIVRIIK